MNDDQPDPAEVEYQAACKAAYAAFDAALLKAWDNYYAVTDVPGLNREEREGAAAERDFQIGNAQSVVVATTEAARKKRDGR